MPGYEFDSSRLPISSSEAPVRRERHEEVATECRRVVRRGHVAGDRDHRPLERRRRNDKALLAGRERDEPPVVEELARALGPLLVADPHRLWIGGPIDIELADELLPVVVARDLAGEAPHLAEQELHLVQTALVQAAGVEVELLGVAQDGGVVLLAERPLAGRGGTHLLQEGGVGLERIGRGRTRRRQVGAMLLRHVRGQEVAHVARTGACLVDGALQDDERHHLGPQVGAAGLEVGRHEAQARGRRGSQLALRAQAVKEEDEDAPHPGVEVEIGLAAPDLPCVVDRPLTKLADGEVAVDRLVEGQLVIGQAGEPLEPCRRAGGIGLDRLGGHVVELVVIVGEAQVRGTNRVGGVLLLEELGGKVSEGRHWMGTPNWLLDTRTGEDAGSIDR